MPQLLEHCYCCSLRIAASVISIYVSVAYMIAFFMELWWVWDTGGQLPYLGYILIAAYFVTFILSAILVKGVSEKQMPHLQLWLFGVLAILLPEGGLVLFMSFQFWKIYTIYGLTEITFWICRLIVNVAGIICVYSLYRLWKEEKQVMASLRDLNMISRSMLCGGGGVRRGSTSSLKALPDGFTNPGYSTSSDTSHLLVPRTKLRRSPSLRSLPPRGASPSPSVNEFNASLYSSGLKSRSSLELHRTPSPTAAWPQVAGTVPRRLQPPPLPLPGAPVLLPPPPPPHLLSRPRPVYTQSLDRRLLHRSRSLGGFFPTEDRMRNEIQYNGEWTRYFNPSSSLSGFLVDPSSGRVAYVQEEMLAQAWPTPTDSKISIESDDMNKYRDVAL